MDKEITRIHNDKMDYEVGKNDVTHINVYMVKGNGNILYQVIRNGKSLFASSYGLKEEYNG